MAEERETKRLWDAMSDLSAYLDDDEPRRAERPADAALRLTTHDNVTRTPTS